MVSDYTVEHGKGGTNPTPGLNTIGVQKKRANQKRNLETRRGREEVGGEKKKILTWPSGDTSRVGKTDGKFRKPSS